MKYVKVYGMTILKFLGFLIGGSIVISLLYYLLFPTKFVNVLTFLYMALVFFTFGFKTGKKTENRGFLAGLKIGFLLLAVLLLFNLVFYQTGFSLIRVIYYMVLLFASVVGATLGINRKKE